MKVGNNVDLRLQSKNVCISDSVVIDDDVRIVVPEHGTLIIDEGVKIGKGTIINVGGKLVIGENTSFYGYCYVQTSSWSFGSADIKLFEYYEIEIGRQCKLAPFTVISGNVVLKDHYQSAPHSIIGAWH